MATTKKFLEFVDVAKKFIEKVPESAAYMNSVVNLTQRMNAMVTDEMIDELITTTNKHIQPKTEENMTTIEMLKELVENGGMYESENNIFWCVTKNARGYIVWSSKKQDREDETVDLTREFMNSTWKPYVKPVDWTKVPIDTKVLCRDGDATPWFKRYFAGFENGIPRVWSNGRTSWSTAYFDAAWSEMKLSE